MIKSPVAELPRAGFVRQKQLLGHILPFGPTTLWRMVASGRFPKPVKLAKRVTAWRWEDINAWMAATE